jgi:hypothetical protein
MGVEEAGADDLGAEDLSAEPGRGADAVARAYAEGMRPPLTEHLAVSLRSGWRRRSLPVRIRARTG